MTKIFAAEIIERARHIQAEWAVADELANERLASQQSTQQMSGGPILIQPPSQSTQETLADSVAEKTLKERIKNQYLGPLLPDHLREAVRRYRIDAEGGGTGYKQVQANGFEGFQAGGNGRRLFK
jgi:transcription initiation factor TFIID subunit 11